MPTYQVGGSVAEEQGFYIEREADTELFDALLNREVCYVFNSRQMGKSSLLLHTKKALSERGYHCAFIDLSRIGSVQINQEQWYAGVISEIWRGLALGATNAMLQWWNQQGEISPAARFANFLDHISNLDPDCQYALFFDEVDSVLSLPFAADDFFAVIRACYNKRAEKPQLENIQFAFFGVALPQDLVSDNTRSPFNIGRAIELTGFELEQAAPLADNFNVSQLDNNRLLQEVLHWSGGQPFLTQKICQLISDNPDNDEARDEALWLTELIQTKILLNWSSQDNPEHLRTIRDRLLNDPRYATFNLDTYARLLDSPDRQFVVDDADYSRLRLSGLINIHHDVLSLRAELYSHVFDREWLTKATGSLRPYADDLQRWRKDHDEAALLSGEALSQAWQWAADKQLPDDDYRFLSASDAREKQQIEDWNSQLFTEIQRRKATEQELRDTMDLLQQAKAEAENANREKSDFVSRLSHDVRTPISHLIGLSELAIEKNEDVGLHGYLQRLLSSSHYLLDIIGDISNINQVDTPRFIERDTNFFPETLIDTFFEIIADRASANQIRLAYSSDPQYYPKCRGDRSHLQQLLLNLGVALIKARNNACLTLSCRQIHSDDDKLRIEVNLALSTPESSIDEDKLPLTLDEKKIQYCQQLADYLDAELAIDYQHHCCTVHFSLEVVENQPLKTLDYSVIVPRKTWTPELVKTLKLLGCKPIVCAADDCLQGKIDTSRMDIMLIDANDLIPQSDWSRTVPHFSGRIVPIFTDSEVSNSKKMTSMLATPVVLPCTPRYLSEILALNLSSRDKLQGQSPAIEQKILVVEDDDILQEIIGEQLRHLQIDFDVANNGEEGLNLAKGNSYQCILMDIEMPVMDGMTAFEALRQHEQQLGTAETPVFAMTAHAMIEDQQRFSQAGFTGLINKPFNKATLEASLAPFVRLK
ncbi:MAG: hypothetical protein AseanaTS_04600 [Candidatus Pelagadaptatus aseana]|uniref:AAA-like domain-containing protein n=1 Tax=Candidatus Pelagadaptatus aseana TaxID=3120508 RepID=UPI0039B2884E